MNRQQKNLIAMAIMGIENGLTRQAAYFGEMQAKMLLDDLFPTDSEMVEAIVKQDAEAEQIAMTRLELDQLWREFRRLPKPTAT